MASQDSCLGEDVSVSHGEQTLNMEYFFTYITGPISPSSDCVWLSFLLLNFHSSAVFNFLEYTTLRRENISLPGLSMATNFPEHWSRKTDPLRDIAGPRLCCSPASDSPWGTACSCGDCSSAKTEGSRQVYSQGYRSSCVGNETVLEAGVVV